MNRFESFYNCARDRGDKYMAIFQKQQGESEPLIFAVSGDWGSVEMQRMRFCGVDSWLTGPSEWEYAYVARFPLDDALEDHKNYLTSLGFVW
jgi:hypothetical protein